MCTCVCVCVCVCAHASTFHLVDSRVEGSSSIKPRHLSSSLQNHPVQSFRQRGSPLCQRHVQNFAIELIVPEKTALRKLYYIYGSAEGRLSKLAAISKNANLILSRVFLLQMVTIFFTTEFWDCGNPEQATTTVWYHCVVSLSKLSLCGDPA